MDNWENDTWSSSQSLNSSDGYSVQNDAGGNSYGAAYQYAYDLQYEESRIKSVMTMSFLFMFVALCISAMAAQFVIIFGLVEQIDWNRALFGVLVIPELVVVFIAKACIKRNMLTPSIFFLLTYSIINGMLFSVISESVGSASITYIFIMAAVVFGVMAIFSALTKRNLTGVGQIGLMLLVSLIIICITYYGISHSSMDMFLPVFFLAIFVGLTAYNVQRIREMAMITDGYSSATIGISGALILYLDFIIIFLILTLALLGIFFLILRSSPHRRSFSKRENE